MFFEFERDKHTYYRVSDNYCGAHFHRSVELLYILEGEKQVFLNGKQLCMKAGELLVCPPYAMHHYLPAPDGRQIVAVFPAEYCKRFEEFISTKEADSPVLNDQSGTLLQLMTALENVDNEVLFEGIINCILGIYIKDKSFRPVKKPADRSNVQRIAEYIEENYAAPVSLSDLAKNFGYSPNYFSALFKKYFRTGVAEYVNSVRVQKSLRLLKTQKISAVYFLCGFRSPQQYFLNFRKFFGCTPREYLHASRV